MVRCARWFADDPFDFDGVPLERVLLLDAASFGDSNWPDVATAARVAAAPWAVRIPRVEFHEYGVGAPVVLALAASPHLRNLRAVQFSDSTTAPDALADLLLAPSVRGIDELVLRGTTGTWAGLDAALARVLADPRAARLRRLGLQAFSVPAAVANVLLTAPGLETTEVCVSAPQPWLTPAVRAALEARFGPRLHVAWSPVALPETWA